MTDLSAFNDIIDLYGWDITIQVSRDYVDASSIFASEKTYLTSSRHVTLEMRSRSGDEHVFRGSSVEEVQAKALKVILA